MDVLLLVMSNCFSYVLFASVFVDVFFKGCFFWGEKIKKPTTFFVGLMMNKTLKLPAQKVGAGDYYSLTHG